MFGYHLFTGNLSFPVLQASEKTIILRQNFWIVIACIFIINLYVTGTSYIIIRTFEKTQATEVLFFLVFLLSLLLDSARLYVPIYGLEGTYSHSLIYIGNITLAARLLAPISLFSLTAFSSEDYRQQTEQNCLITILVSVFFAVYIPLNTGVVAQNLLISYGFTKAIHLFSVIISLISVLTLYFHNKKNDFNQLNTLGFVMIIIGYNFLFSVSNILGAITGTAILAAGTWIYLTKLHQHYLWTD